MTEEVPVDRRMNSNCLMGQLSLPLMDMRTTASGVELPRPRSPTIGGWYPTSAIRSPRRDDATRGSNPHLVPTPDGAAGFVGVGRPDRWLYSGKRGEHPRNRARTGVRVNGQQDRVTLRDMENDRPRLEQGEFAFFMVGICPNG
jgi:hypothetical protein